MKWGSELAEQRDLGGLGVAGICREISRVVLRFILPNFVDYGPPLLSALLLADAAFFCDLYSRLVGSGVEEGPTSLVLRLEPGAVALAFLDTICVYFLLHRTAAYLLCVASLYRTGGHLLAADRALKEDLPDDTLSRLVWTFILVAVPFIVVFGSLSVAALFRVQAKIMIPLWLLGWAGAAYAAPVAQLACVVSVVEDAELLGAVRRSRELLAGKFLVAACVLATLDGCIVAVLKAFMAMVVNDALDLGLAFQVGMGAAMFVALWALLITALVAQPVVYMVCQRHHQDVVDEAHLD